MLFRDCTLFTEQQQLAAEEIFGIQISKGRTPVGFDDGDHAVAELRIDFWEPTGLALQLLQRSWVMGPRYSTDPNDATLVWLDTTGEKPQWLVKHIPHVCRTSIEADGLRADEVVTLTSTPEKTIYLFFKDTTFGHISLVHPFAQFAVSKALFTDAELTSLQSRIRTPVVEAETDFDRFKKLFDSVNQRYTTATLSDGDAEKKGYRKDIVSGMALHPATVNPPRHQRLHWKEIDAYTSAFYFDGAGKYVGMAILPT